MTTTTSTCATTGETALVVDNINYGSVFVLCDCGPNYPVDEDGCCLMCGEDAFNFAVECTNVEIGGAK